jgi:uncharacterized membrane protein (DUF485 family)
VNKAERRERFHFLVKLPIPIVVAVFLTASDRWTSGWLLGFAVITLSTGLSGIYWWLARRERMRHV